MAVPTVLGRNMNGGLSTSAAIAFDATPSVGELLIVEFTAGATSQTIAISAGTGWTAMAQIDATTSMHSRVFYKVADGSDSLTLSLVSARYVYMARRISGGVWAGLASTTGASGNANPPNNAPGLGSKDFLWLAGCSVSTATVPSAAPSGYSNLNTRNQTGGTVTSGHAEKTAAAATSEDPGTFTNAANSGWGAWTIAVNESVAGTTGQIKAYNGSAFVAKPVKWWNGSAWVVKPLKRWNGSAWITTPY